MKSTLPITLQVGSINDLSSDAYLAIPLDSLGEEYWIMSYLFPEQSKYLQGPSQFAVIASEDLTEIELIFPNDDFPDVSLEESLETGQWKVRYNLNSYEALQVQSGGLLGYSQRVT